MTISRLDELPGVLAPISNLPEGTILPSAYIIHQRSSVCEHCGRISEWSEAYAFNQLRSRTGAGKYVRNLVRVSTFLYNIPIHTIPVGEEYTPACFECVEVVDLTSLPKLEQTELWQAAITRKQEEAARALEQAAAKRKDKPSTSDLLNLF